MPFQKLVAVIWADVKKHDRILLNGEVWDVLKVKAEGKKVRVTVAREGKQFSGKMPTKGQVERYEKLAGKKWSEPDDKAEEILRDILGAEIAGIRPGKNEAWIVPMVDQSTIAAHLLTFHGIQPLGRESEAYERMVALHTEDHEKLAIDDLHVPHRHEKKRPVVDVGPKFA